ncbi:MAG TPA: carboxypeptidase regulatory-like domain-containing protein, partial [Bryobacteraceae bacterium]
MRSLRVWLPAILLSAGCLFAQSSAGTISGRVVDASGGAITGAEVRVVNDIDQQGRTFESSATGEFTFPQLAPGNYTLSIKMAGFKQFDKTGLHLSASDSMDVGALRLDVGAVSETVEVRAEGAVVETASGDRAHVIDSNEITDLMARGRDVMAMLQILPGVVNDNTGSDVLGQFTTPTIDGMRNNYNSLTIDGISGNTARGSNAQSPINLDAISEVKVFANSYPAEIGPSASGAILIATKSGTQSFHGGVYYYNRNEVFNANNFFNNRQGIQRQRYRYNTVGEDLGGPIYIPGHFNRNKQKLFFFFSQEIDPNQTPISVSNFTVPTALERQGNFSQSYKNATTLYAVKDPSTGSPFPGNIVPASRIDANSAKLLSIFPMPNATNTALTKYAYNFQIAGTEDTPVHQEIMKVDYNMSERSKLWFRASGFKSDSTGLNSAAINNKWGPAPVDYQQTMPNLGANWVFLFSPTLINETTVGMNLWTETQVLTKEGLAAYQRATYGINIPQTYPEQNPLGVLPAMSFGGVSSPAQISYDGRFPMVDDSTSYTFKDVVSKVWNAHLFKAGFQFQHALYNQYHQAGSNAFPGAFSFANDSNNPLDSGYAYANAILGNYDTYNETTNRVNYAPITTIAEWFVQDKWRVTSRLTVDVGVRFTDALPLTPNNNNAANFIPYLFNPAQAPVLYRPEVVNGQKVTVNPLTGAVVLPVYSGLIVPGSGNMTNGVVQP